ncbi:type IV conjugative transfer system protein TraE [Geoalkalibacter halelectricus]|uniref:type IV conjugative transfer system protein TraE n=1 Tax=Geoalkalibacter halelectricus TaxID=2847045 RepID=UPI0026708FF3|nr:type IV conjugative transfer system protein TraE [Geoalkalibacter halelectricus]MDO3380356.1 type IV conjugative transfer system protein TraE [Geoalkalibacter halelectricus]
MNHDLFIEKTSNLFAKYRVFLFIVVALCITVAYQATVIAKVSQDARTVIIPAGLDEKVQVTAGSVDDVYKRQMGRYIAGLFLNYTPATARLQFDELLTLFPPERFEDARDELHELAETIESSRLTSTFHISKIEGVGNKINVEGVRRLLVSGQQTENERRKYVMTYAVANGKFYLVSIDSESRR